jgi:nicotinamide-nucleotide amidase
MAASDLALAEEVRALFMERGLRLSVAESVTGGRIASLLTSAPGASGYLHSSVVCYSPKSKQSYLGLDPSLLPDLISEETASALARGALEATGADVALSATGNAGPVAMEEKPVGLVCVGVAMKERISVRMLELKGSREEIQSAAAREALEFMLDEMRT